MLRRSSATVADCYRRAAEAAERAEQASTPDDRKFWLVRERRWLELAKHQEASERLKDFVRSRSASVRAPAAHPSPEEALRLLAALNGLSNPDDLAEVYALAERLAGEKPEVAALMDRRRTRH